MWTKALLSTSGVTCENHAGKASHRGHSGHEGDRMWTKALLSTSGVTCENHCGKHRTEVAEATEGNFRMWTNALL
jgi:hypothetical protein